MNAYIAVGDIHGRPDALQGALEAIARDDDHDAAVVFVGDYVDRGPDARGVIERLMAGQAEGRPWICLKGNHDLLFSEFLQGPDPAAPEHWSAEFWLEERMGGRETLASYGVDAAPDRPLLDLRAEALAKVPQAHALWLSSRPLVHQTARYIFVHAGLRPGVALADQAPDDLMWIRRDFLDHRGAFEKVVVHGHTPADMPEHRGNRVNVDGGAGFGRPLYPVLLRGEAVFMLGPYGRAALLP